MIYAFATSRQWQCLSRIKLRQRCSAVALERDPSGCHKHRSRREADRPTPMVRQPGKPDRRGRIGLAFGADQSHSRIHSLEDVRHEFSEPRGDLWWAMARCGCFCTLEADLPKKKAARRPQDSALRRPARADWRDFQPTLRTRQGWSSSNRDVGQGNLTPAFMAAARLGQR